MYHGLGDGFGLVHHPSVNVGFHEGTVVVHRRMHTPLKHQSKVGFRSRHIPTHGCPFHPLHEHDTVALNSAGEE